MQYSPETYYAIRAMLAEMKLENAKAVNDNTSLPHTFKTFEFIENSLLDNT
ncbi:MAG: hypothetical protein HRU18_02800 [Pseudoalteromonas sp.]|uniref:hypothetical protein n=1 Tax=Pseudoalteromonas sp. TaxID=53249 RepID=UPI001D37CFC4|nr:hypothetical protein [Pseudoalteromonas sp.]NRA77113.1 hypothetical protein [Pseudoalteromonas sp.]